MSRSNTTSMPENGFWTNLRYQLVFNSFIRPSNILRLARHLPDISLCYWPRALLIAITSLLTQPLRLAELARHGRRIARTEITEPPIFIIGHWRSGTTHLHNLFSQDPSLGWLTMYQAIAPDCSLIGGRWLKRLLGRVLPQHRPMDNMIWPIDSPQEEEVALGKTTAYSFYSQFMFPRETRAFFGSFVLLRDASDRIAAEVKARYRRILQVASIHAEGRRLVLKNPVNTARIRMLLQLFPDAKFVHIHRSPYEVYASTRNLHRQITAFTTLQSLDGNAGPDTVLALYEEMMRQFFADRALIPAGNLAEVRFDDLERDPLGEMRRMYQELSLPGFTQAEAPLRRYIASQASYRKNGFALTEIEHERVARHWTFAFAELGYAAQVPASGTLA
jgi:omega-hydroxy-beta-dihydromenaquinone-9 sulfotransferase